MFYLFDRYFGIFVYFPFTVLVNLLGPPEPSQKKLDPRPLKILWPEGPSWTPAMLGRGGPTKLTNTVKVKPKNDKMKIFFMGGQILVRQIYLWAKLTNIIMSIMKMKTFDPQINFFEHISKTIQTCNKFG